MEFTLKELCKCYKEVSDNIIDCCNFRSEYLMLNKGKYHFEELSEEDIKCLRPYLQCDILAIYEYLARLDNIEPQDWFKSYQGVSCPKDENDEYIELKQNPIAPENADEIFDSMLSRSIEPFKSRGIPATCFDYTV